MDLYTAKSGDTLYKIAKGYGVSPEKLISDNMLPDPDRLSVGEAVAVVTPSKRHTVREGETLDGIARRYGSDKMSLWQYNPSLSGIDQAPVGESLTVRTASPIQKSIATGVAVDADADEALLRQLLPYATMVAVEHALLDENGGVSVPMDALAVALAPAYNTIPLIKITNGEGGSEAAEKTARALFGSMGGEKELAETLLSATKESGYRGCILSVNGLSRELIPAYIQFVKTLHGIFKENELYLFIRIPISESLRYRGIENAVTAVILESDNGLLPTEADMRSGIREAESFVAPEKLMVDIPLYAYERLAKTKENLRRMPTRNAIEGAKDERAEILYDTEDGVPHYTYFEKDGTEKETYFTDARSVASYLSLVGENDLLGAFFLPMGSFYSPAFLSLATSFYIQKPTY